MAVGELVAGAVGAFAGGGLAGWFGRPAAAGKAESKRQLIEGRRSAIAGARALYAEYLRRDEDSMHGEDVNLMTDTEFIHDERFLAVRRNLSDETRAMFAERPPDGKSPGFQIQAGGLHAFLDDLDRLEAEWHLS